MPGSDASEPAMVLTLAILLLVCWWFLWGIFHLAGSGIHAALAVGFALLVYRLVRQSDVRQSDIRNPGDPRS